MGGWITRGFGKQRENQENKRGTNGSILLRVGGEVKCMGQQYSLLGIRIAVGPADGNAIQLRTHARDTIGVHNIKTPPEASRNVVSTVDIHYRHTLKPSATKAGTVP